MNDEIYAKIRLSKHDVDAIASKFLKHFLKDDKLWIFGSRANLEKKGGDIDLYIETAAKTIDDVYKMKINFLCDLEQKIGEQKIDVVVNMLNFPHPLAIHQVAKSEGIRMI